MPQGDVYLQEGAAGAGSATRPEAKHAIKGWSYVGAGAGAYSRSRGSGDDANAVARGY
jgi:hypothetical protein